MARLTDKKIEKIPYIWKYSYKYKNWIYLWQEHYEYTTPLAHWEMGRDMASGSVQPALLKSSEHLAVFAACWRETRWQMLERTLVTRQVMWILLDTTEQSPHGSVQYGVLSAGNKLPIDTLYCGVSCNVVIARILLLNVQHNILLVMYA